MAITILEGSNFCISDQNGDFTFTTSGLYAYDTRFLSRLELTINGERPSLLSAGKAEYYSAAYFLRNPPAGELLQDTVSIGRNRFVGEGMQDHLRVQNQSQENISFELALEFGSDFADIFAVKNHDFALGDPLKAIPLPPLAEGRYEEDENQFVFDDDTGLAANAGDPFRARARRAGEGQVLDRARAAGRPGISASTSSLRSAATR